MKLRYAVVFEQTPNNYCASVPDVPAAWALLLALQDLGRRLNLAHLLPSASVRQRS